MADLTDLEYHRLIDALLRRIEVQADRWLQDDVIDIDAQRAGSMLELSFPNRSKIVVNAQPPLHELWLASKAGGYHFAWRDGQWADTKTGQPFDAVFNEQVSLQAGRPLQLSS
jgi:CyaY protein